MLFGVFVFFWGVFTASLQILIYLDESILKKKKTWAMWSLHCKGFWIILEQKIDSNEQGKCGPGFTFKNQLPILCFGLVICKWSLSPAPKPKPDGCSHWNSWARALLYTKHDPRYISDTYKERGMLQQLNGHKWTRRNKFSSWKQCLCAVYFRISTLWLDLVKVEDTPW